MIKAYDAWKLATDTNDENLKKELKKINDKIHEAAGQGAFSVTLNTMSAAAEQIILKEDPKYVITKTPSGFNESSVIISWENAGEIEEGT